jgi:hypothetical protein
MKCLSRIKLLLKNGSVALGLFALIVAFWLAIRDKFDSFFLGTQTRRLINTIISREKSYDDNNPRIPRLCKLRQRDPIHNGLMS